MRPQHQVFLSEFETSARVSIPKNVLLARLELIARLRVFSLGQGISNLIVISHALCRRDTACLSQLAVGGHLALVQGLSASKHEGAVLTCQLGVPHHALVVSDRLRDVLSRLEGLLLCGHKVIDRVLGLLGPGGDLLA